MNKPYIPVAELTPGLLCWFAPDCMDPREGLVEILPPRKDNPCIRFYVWQSTSMYSYQESDTMYRRSFYRLND